MAGGKESPRQKLIGMMYLVLTALLALQTNSAILMKFQLMDNALIAANGKAKESVAGQIATLEKKAAEANRARDKAILETAKGVQARTAETIAYLESMRTEMIKLGGGYAEDGVNYKDVSAEDKMAAYFIPPGNKGKALELKTKLDEYVEYIKKWVPNAAPLALSAKEDPIASKDEHQRTKGFGELYFEATPMVASLATISQKENAILRYQAEALANIAGKLDELDIKPTGFGAAVSAESKTVAAGAKYVGSLYLAAQTNNLNPTMTMDGRPLQVDPKTGMAKIEFTATPGAYDKDGNAKKTFTGVIKFKKNGRDTTFTVKQEYIVAKPVVQVQSGVVSSLYLNCGNKLSIQVPALGSTYDPSFSATGAQVIKGAEKGQITVVPTEGKVAIKVSSNGNALSTENFGVRLIPKPEIVLMSGGRPVNMAVGADVPGPRELTLMAKPDETFKNSNPDDAKYSVTRFKITLARQKRQIATQDVSANAINLSGMAAQAKPGDRYVIQVQEVKRKNFRGSIEPVSGVNSVMTVSLNGNQ